MVSVGESNSPVNFEHYVVHNLLWFESNHDSKPMVCKKPIGTINVRKKVDWDKSKRLAFNFSEAFLSKCKELSVDTNGYIPGTCHYNIVDCDNYKLLTNHQYPKTKHQIVST